MKTIVKIEIALLVIVLLVAAGMILVLVRQRWTSFTSSTARCWQANL